MLNIMLLAAVLFTSACSGNQATANSVSPNNIVSVETRKNDDGNKKNKKFASYLTNIDEDAEEVIADFDFDQYLVDSGAEAIERLDDHYDGEVVIATRYSNGVIVLYTFCSDLSDPDSYGYLTYIQVFVAEEGYDINGMYNGSTPESEQLLHSEWAHNFTLFGPEIVTNNLEYSKDHEWKRYYAVKPGGVYYIQNNNGKKNLIAVPEYFEDGFKASILPYIKLTSPSFRKDPLEGKVLGSTDDL